MKLGRNQFAVVMRKRYFRSEELVEILNKDKAEITRIACMAKALYKIENLYLVDYNKTYEFICSNEMFYENKDGKYITVAEASKELGIPESCTAGVGKISGSIPAFKIHTYQY